MQAEADCLGHVVELEGGQHGAVAAVDAAALAADATQAGPATLDPERSVILILTEKSLFVFCKSFSV